ncbi:hypothetical protein ILUMI_06530 [Ignelater luminosus]|uniref:Uncharacterized protein n=1 Tax=Ignelater luminosus TaxID=2038154 RepID=A0A8K0D540_IGNLU|nr:hypothetical protein ILUMI_06530 [Ignelater luminosus]
MNKTLLIASILLTVAIATARGARYGTGEGLDPGADSTKTDASSASGGVNSDPNFVGVNGPSHTGVNGGQGQTGTYGSHEK